MKINFKKGSFVEINVFLQDIPPTNFGFLKIKNISLVIFLIRATYYFSYNYETKWKAQLNFIILKKKITTKLLKKFK